MSGRLKEVVFVFVFLAEVLLTAFTQGHSWSRVLHVHMLINSFHHCSSASVCFCMHPLSQHLHNYIKMPKISSLTQSVSFAQWDRSYYDDSPKDESMKVIFGIFLKLKPSFSATTWSTKPNHKPWSHHSHSDFSSHAWVKQVDQNMYWTCAYLRKKLPVIERELWREFFMQMLKRKRVAVSTFTLVFYHLVTKPQTTRLQRGRQGCEGCGVQVTQL